MKIVQMKCPSCGANLKTSQNSSFCEFCGAALYFDDGNKQIRIEKNINVNSKNTTHKILTDDAKILQIQAEERKDKRSTVSMFMLIFVMIAIGILPFVIYKGYVAKNKNEGKIQAGNYSELVGEDYRTVEAHFRAAGFCNIELIDLDDAGVMFWKRDKVSLISIAGETRFSSDDWFDPNSQVVISYH